MAQDSLQKLIEEELARLAGKPTADPADVSSLLEFFQWIDRWRALGGETLPALPAASSAQAASPMSPASAVVQAQTRVLVQNPAPAQPSAAEGGNDGIAAGIGNAALRLFTSGFGLASLVSGIIGLFDGGEPAPEPLVKFVLPPSLRIEAADPGAGGGVQFVDYGQEGRPRAWGGAAAGLLGAETAAASVPPPPVAVPAQPLDNRFFLDHSQEIARAVREAMLNMHALNDVVSDL